MRLYAISLLSILAVLAGRLTAQVHFEKVTLTSFDGRSTPVELGQITVPSSRAHPIRQFQVAFYRLASPQKQKSVPIVFLMGGPGVPATFIAKVPPYFSLFTRLANVAPVILLDQRGVGLSKPNVDCPAGPRPPANLFTTPAALVDAYATIYAKCADHWSAEGTADNFSVQEVAEDVESLRLAIGAPKVDLLALSFGTRIALEVVVRHPQSVRRIVLQGTLTRDGLVRLPLEMDEFFRQTAAESRPSAIANSLDPDLEMAYRRVAEQLQRESLPVTIHGQNGDELHVAIGRDLFAALVATRTTDPRLPALLTSLETKDTSVIAPILQSIYQDLEKGAGNLMSHSVVCSATDVGSRFKMAKKQTSASFLPEPFDNAMVTDDFCRRIGANRRPTNIPLTVSEVPILFINGDLDDRTPPSLTHAAAKQFKHSHVIVVKNGGHELLPEEKIQEIVTQYFSGQDPGGSSVALPPRVFLSVTEAARPPQHPR